VGLDVLHFNYTTFFFLLDFESKLALIIAVLAVLLITILNLNGL